MFTPSTHPLGFLLSAFYFQLSSPRALGLLLGGGEVGQAAKGMGSNRKLALSHLWKGQPMV
jgi:hypothetical protein